MGEPGGAVSIGAETTLAAPAQAAGHGTIKVAGAVAPVACAAVLLIAVLLKTYQLFTDQALGVLYGSRWLQAGLVEYELLLALWLLSGVGPAWGRRGALYTFVGFGCFAFSQAVSGALSCGCFGKASINPWWTFALDAALVGLLFVWKPVSGKTVSRTAAGFGHLKRIPPALAIPTLLVVTSVPLFLSATVARPGSSQQPGASFNDNNYVLLKPETWVGNQFPLTEFVNLPERERLFLGSWVLVFYHADCPKCRKVLPHYERLVEDFRKRGEEVEILFIEIPPCGPDGPTTKRSCHHACLEAGKEWFITTPHEVRMTAGRVTGATADEGSFLIKASPGTQQP